MLSLYELLIGGFGLELCSELLCYIANEQMYILYT